uniref:Uncharacterized protein n=1 Tax=Pfiesteria piscicida TaxID=71001 RepID=A3E3T0_PFIPI|nr:unknown [Pfiesteria piscicida]
MVVSAAGVKGCCQLVACLCLCILNIPATLWYYQTFWWDSCDDFAEEEVRWMTRMCTNIGPTAAMHCKVYMVISDVDPTNSTGFKSGDVVMTEVNVDRWPKYAFTIDGQRLKMSCFGGNESLKTYNEVGRISRTLCSRNATRSAHSGSQCSCGGEIELDHWWQPRAGTSVQDVRDSAYAFSKGPMGTNQMYKLGSYDCQTFASFILNTFIDCGDDQFERPQNKSGMSWELLLEVCTVLYYFTCTICLFGVFACLGQCCTSGFNKSAGHQYFTLKDNINDGGPSSALA